MGFVFILGLGEESVGVREIYFCFYIVSGLERGRVCFFEGVYGYLYLWFVGLNFVFICNKYEVIF